MEKQTAQMTEEQKEPLKFNYNQKQLKFEQCLESSVALLNYFFLDELDFMETLDYRSNV